MKIHIERKPKKVKEKKTKKTKIIHVGTHKKSVLFLWCLLIGSFTFGLYKNFTAIDTHTIHETKTIEPMIVDTHAIENFTLNFVQEYYAWENNKDALEERIEKVNNYLTPQLQELNIDTIRSDIPTSSKVKSVQIWKIEPIDDENYVVVYTVEQEVTEEKETRTNSSNFKLIIHQDSDNNLIIIRNPVFWTTPKKSAYQPPEIKNDLTVDEETQQEVLSFLETFFQLYPTASESELAYYVKDNVLPVINKEILFSNLIDPVISRDGDNFQVSLAVKYLDNSVSKSELIAQYELTLQKDENWKIISVSS